MGEKDRYSGRVIDWNDTSYPAVRQAEREEREDFELGGCDTEESLREDDEADRLEETGQDAIHIVYPEDKHVSPERIESWYADALANGEIGQEHLDAKDVEAKARALDDAGIITVGKPSHSI